MRLNRVLLETFRNYGRQEISFDPVCNVICGENAQGKTNLLEAMVCLSTGKSHRTRTDRELIQFEAEGFQIEGDIFARGRTFTNRIEVGYGRKKKITVNQVPAKTASELSNVLNTVFFCPEDLQLIRDGAAARRRFMDASLCQLRPKYAAALSEYQRLHEHKTRILRDCVDRPDLIATLPDFNLRMAETGAILIYYRARFVKLLSFYASTAHNECSGGREELTIEYKTVKTVTDLFADLRQLTVQLLEHQREHHYAEVSSRQCLSGPHKDDLEVALGGVSARSYASQGQTRTAALAMKLAAREIHKEIIGEYPILLLDDVLSELDPKRQEYVLNRLGNGQVFITCCEEDRLHALLKGKVFRVSGGVVAG
ncbi:MAG: DNA replication/repair protein RecF [Oscillospiraceae bacterium]|nr:DNA replication/repair protein RecF [Oscillospiraceae bacterium]